MNNLLSFALISGVFGQQLISLSHLKGANVPNFLKNENVVSLYVSASFDDDDVLANVMVVSGKDKVSLQDLKYRTMETPVNSEIQRPYPIQPNSYITSNLADFQLANLKGVLYYNTAKQFQNGNFYVIDVHSVLNIDLQKLGDVEATVVFLSTMTNTMPNLSSKISNWKQDQNASIAIYNGIPQDGIELKNTQIFSNPVHSDIFDWLYFKNVETFSLSSVAFYLDSFKGCTFKIEPGKAILGGTTTTALTTTGFYMKSSGEQQTVTRVNMMKDTHSNGYTGANILGHVPNGATVTFYVEDNGKNYCTDTVPTDFFAPWSTPVVGDDIVINSISAQMGQYFVQYFVVQGKQLNFTTAAPGEPTANPSCTIPTVTTTVHLETTTKLSGRVFTELLTYMIVLILGRCF
ncbi:Protein CBG12160 [Caenorhabditis briggsae]|uniref:Uncharacterized protein n=2 Tax=Caenorhabditis briggsae TaxID=6238 RepID=A0AAE9A337_CAEBR|nr:Protein CBG12160 [Caenorhabditis briggsae]ULT87672.1 hypothetical protein L3Y34_007082 [Caenorhabditis briggsae]CAP31185.2 Protein CBG12160 [Caenorhabditis briggsae]